MFDMIIQWFTYVIIGFYRYLRLKGNTENLKIQVIQHQNNKDVVYCLCGFSSLDHKLLQNTCGDTSLSIGEF